MMLHGSCVRMHGHQCKAVQPAQKEYDAAVFWRRYCLNLFPCDVIADGSRLQPGRFLRETFESVLALFPSTTTEIPFT
jgi:hypothetical protein